MRGLISRLCGYRPNLNHPPPLRLSLSVHLSVLQPLCPSLSLSSLSLPARATRRAHSLSLFALSSLTFGRRGRGVPASSRGSRSRDGDVRVCAGGVRTNNLGETLQSNYSHRYYESIHPPSSFSLLSTLSSLFSLLSSLSLLFLSLSLSLKETREEERAAKERRRRRPRCFQV